MSTIGVVAAATVALTVTTPDRAASTAEEVIADLAESSQAARAETQPDETQPDEWDSGGAEQGDATGTGSEDNTGSAALTDSGGEDSPLTVMLIGDSAAWSLGGGEISFSDDHGPYVSPFDSEEVILVNLARKGYRLVPGSITDVGVRARNYADLDDEMLWRSTAAEIHPDVTAIMLGLSDIQSRVIDGTVVPFGSAEFDARLRAAAEELLGDLSRSGQVVILTSPPLIGADMPEPAMAEFFVEHGSSRIDHLNLVLAAVAIDEPLVDVVAFGGWLCPGLSENGRQSDIGLQSGCRLTIEGEPTRFDGLHFNTEGALMATQWLTGQFLEITARGGAT